MANVILDGDEANADDDADEFLVEEKPKDAIDLELDITAAATGPSSGLNSTDVRQNYFMLMPIFRILYVRKQVRESILVVKLQ